MSFFKETSPIDKAIKSDRPVEVDAPKFEEPDIPKVGQGDRFHWIPYIEAGDGSISYRMDIFRSAFKSFGLISGTNEVKSSETAESSEGKDYSHYLEKGDDGKYYDKETGKDYDSVDPWVKTQETMVKRYESIAQYFEDRAQKELARIKNGEFETEKWGHYHHSQEFYAKAEHCRETAAHIREKLSSVSEAAVGEKADAPEKKGGSYKEVKENSEGETHEVHHMPADSVSPLERGDGPAIKMEKEDHQKTASYGSSRAAREYRAQQQELIEQGKFREALQMDIDDIHDKFGDKYDDAIAEMLAYVDKLEQEGKLDG